MKRNLLWLACLFAVSFGMYANSLIWKLELPEPHLKLARSAESAPRQTTYGFDDSFRQHFGQRGVDHVETSIKRGITDLDKILGELGQEPKFRYDLR